MNASNRNRKLTFLSIGTIFSAAAVLPIFLACSLAGWGLFWPAACSMSSHAAVMTQAAGSAANAGSRLQVPAGYRLTFEDDFNSLSISDADGANARWFTQTVQCCMYDTSHPSTPTHMAPLSSPPDERPFTLDPGQGLGIELRKVHNEWFSGVLSTVDRRGHGFAQQYGYFEMKANFPNAPGTWPAFWLLNQAALTSHRPAAEIDVVESYMKAPDYINITLHDWSPPAKTVARHLARVNDLTQGFHTFAMLWTPEVMEFACDGEILFTTRTPESMHQPFYPVIDLGLGGGWPTDKTPPRSRLLVRYLKVYAPG
jgi:hypothetical protein